MHVHRSQPPTPRIPPRTTPDAGCHGRCMLATSAPAASPSRVASSSVEELDMVMAEAGSRSRSELGRFVAAAELAERFRARFGAHRHRRLPPPQRHNNRRRHPHHQHPARRRPPDRDGTDYLTGKTWQRTAEIAAQHLTRGRRVAIVGQLEHHDWTDPTATATAAARSQPTSRSSLGWPPTRGNSADVRPYGGNAQLSGRVYAASRPACGRSSSSLSACS